MTPPSDERSLFSAGWAQLQQEGEAPQLKGRSAEQDQRDKGRKRRMMPTEKRRRGRKITPTLSAGLVEELRQICQKLGYVNDKGEGVIASSIVEQFLHLAVEAYHQGKIELYEEQIVETETRLRWR